MITFQKAWEKLIIKKNWKWIKIYVFFFALLQHIAPKKYLCLGWKISGWKTPKNDLFTISFGLQGSFITLSTWRTTKRHKGPLMKLNACWRLTVYPVFKDEKSNESDEKSVKQKNGIKMNNRTNIIATNFVWEQLTSRTNTKRGRVESVKQSVRSIALS